MSGSADPFGTAERRDAILAAWHSSPTRFREDANAEEDLAVGGYADRLLVELAQNAADAAARAGIAGRLSIRVLSTPDGPVLSAANTGAPLDAAGVDSLTSLRASAKRDAGQSVGRFGVGFVAVLAVCDEPSVRSRHGGVRFSAAATTSAIADRPPTDSAPAGNATPAGNAIPAGGTGPAGSAADAQAAGTQAADAQAAAGPAGSAGGAEEVGSGAPVGPVGSGGGERVRAEVARRGGRVPVLRLAWPEPAAPPEGYDTEVWLPLRDAAALAVVREALAGFDPALLLGLPALSTVDVDGTVVTRAVDGDDVLLSGTRWRVRRAGGELPAALLADRPVEERERAGWTMLAAVPVRDGVPRPLGPQLVHAPTPTDEPLGVPVRLVGTFPLDPARRRVPAGPLAGWLADRAAEVLADLLRSVADTPAVLDLLPPPGLPGGRLAADVREALYRRLRDTELLPVAAGGRVAPPRAVAVPDALVPPLTGVLDGLLPAGWWSAATGGSLAALGVRALDVAEVVGALAGQQREPHWWRSLYAALAALPLEPADREALAALPVPLADGRTATGPARVLLPAAELPPGLADLGLLVAHRDAAHPLLERLGAQPATPAGVLHDERVRAAVAASLDAEDPEPVAHAVLGLVAAAPQPTDREVLAELALPDRYGDWAPAGDLLLPGSPIARLVDPAGPFGVLDERLVARYGAETLAAVGVLASFAVLDESDVDIADVAELGLDGAEDWIAAVAGEDPVPGSRILLLRAVRDLEWVRADGWPAALDLLAAPPLRAVLAADCELIAPDGTVSPVPGYTRWWLSRRPVLGGRRPVDCCASADSELAGLYDPAPGDPELAALLGAWRGLADLLAAATTDLGDEPPAAVSSPSGDPTAEPSAPSDPAGAGVLHDPADADVLHGPAGAGGPARAAGAGVLAGAGGSVAADLLRRLADPDRTVVPELLAVVYPRLAAALPDPELVDPPSHVRVAPGLVVPAEHAVVLDQPWLLSRLGDRYPVPAGAAPAAVAELLDLPLLSEL